MTMSDFLSGIFATIWHKLLFAIVDESGNVGDDGGAGDGDGDDNAGGSQDGNPDGGEGDGGKPPAGDEGGGADDGTDGSGDDTNSDLPEAYEFDHPTVEDLSDAHRAAYNEAFREMGLSQEAVNRLLETEARIAEELQTQGQETMQAQRDEWLEAAKADKELGADWALTEKRAGFAMKQIAENDPDFADLLNDTGLGDHPTLLKAFARLGQYMSNDRFDDGDSSKDDVSTESTWYGDTTPETKRG